jgi:hypothetical protein
MLQPNLSLIPVHSAHSPNTLHRPSKSWVHKKLFFAHWSKNLKHPNMVYFTTLLSLVVLWVRIKAKFLGTLLINVPLLRDLIIILSM